MTSQDNDHFENRRRSNMVGLAAIRSSLENKRNVRHGYVCIPVYLVYHVVCHGYVEYRPPGDMILFLRTDLEFSIKVP